MSNSIGKVAEHLVDLSLNQYDLWWSPTWPEVIFLGKGNIRVTGNALPDRIAIHDGHPIMIEIKTWKAKNQYTLRKRLHQYDILKDVSDHKATCFYLVLWRWQDQEEWRLYLIEELEKQRDSIIFQRKEGRYVEGDIPQWLPVLTR